MIIETRQRNAAGVLKVPGPDVSSRIPTATALITFRPVAVPTAAAATAVSIALILPSRFQSARTSYISFSARNIA
jgi:hypothetical protein